MTPPVGQRIGEALRLVESWPTDRVAAAVVDPGGVVARHGDTTRAFALASVSKPITAYAALVASEEGSIGLDEPVGRPGCTVRHLLAHAGGYPFDGDAAPLPPGTRRIYSNVGFEILAGHVAGATGFRFAEYATEAITAPLGMTATDLRGSPAAGYTSTVEDLARFATELLSPRLISPATLGEATTSQFPTLAGVVPGFGPFDPCPWGLGFELRGNKFPHWTAPGNSPQTFGHFGSAGTFVWVDPAAGIGLVVLTDRAFGGWAHKRWPELGDAVLSARVEEQPDR